MRGLLSGCTISFRSDTKFSNLLDRGANAGTTRNEKGQSTDSSHLFNVPGFPFLPFLIHFRKFE